MCDCFECLHHGHTKGACRGVMDCDPDEDWCELDSEFYCLEGYEIESMLRDEYIKELISKGMDEEEAENLAEEEEFDRTCPDFEDAWGYFEDRYDPPWDTTEEKLGLK